MIVYIDDILIYSKNFREKCKFHRDTITFLGGGGVKMDTSKVRAVTDWPNPTSIKELQWFLALQTFTDHSSAIIAQLPPPSLHYYRANPGNSTGGWSCLWETKTEFHFNRFLLSQRHGIPTQLYPCTFFSYKLSLAEANYDVGSWELLSIKEALEKWHYWLEGAQSHHRP